MDSRAFLDLRPSHNPYRWTLPVVRSLTTQGGFLFGGCALGAAISALEATSGRETIWATGQYLSYARPGEVVDIDVTIAVSGRQTTQARAVCHVGNREILTVNAALGHRELELGGQWEQMPDAPPPAESSDREFRLPPDGTIHDKLEQRTVKVRPLRDLDGTSGDGRTIMWARIPDVIDGVDTATLAILGDFVPMSVGQSLGIRGGGNSLDNTLRVVQIVPTEWVLLDIRTHAVARGFGHGLVHMFAEDGTLMATASQSCIVRMWERAEPTRVSIAQTEGSPE
jgi:acyl-CoA thioesterase